MGGREGREGRDKPAHFLVASAAYAHQRCNKRKLWQNLYQTTVKYFFYRFSIQDV